MTQLTHQLNTVTYGVSSSPFLAIRCLLQLAQEGEHDFPLAAHAIRNALYVDDFATGADDLQTASELKKQLIGLLQRGQFELRKWASNHPDLLHGLPPEHCQIHASSFDSDSDTVLKILGLLWQSSSDSFSFSVQQIESPFTKRSILSEIARIYDPLGFLCPITFFAKRLIQHLWSLGLDWDSEPPSDVCEQWKYYKSSLPVISELSIPRRLRPTLSTCQLHGFCDASESGMAAVVYFRCVDPEGRVHVSFVMAKSKVAPLKRISIPRLELCAAVLLAKLIAHIVQNCSESVVIEQIFAWSDSTVTLSWIHSSPHKWKTFVANRVTYIQDKVPPDRWHHVRSAENPADPASRGLFPRELLLNSLWWAGPQWLMEPPENWPLNSSSSSADVEIQEEARVVVLHSQVVTSDIESLLTRFSSLRKIQGIVAYCLRFLHNARHNLKLGGPLTDAELHQSLLLVVKAVQAMVFQPELAKLQSGQPCSKYLQKLSLFIDNAGILRVGGRLVNSSLPFETKHPALLPRRHRLTELVILQVHNQHMHPGVQTTMYLVQQKFWVLSFRQTIRHYLKVCNRCFRVHPRSLTPYMGNLPSFRVSQVKAFSCVGVDYGGPFPILMSRHRGARTQKAYLCLFVCAATRAIHVEVASDLSSETFLAALRRFISRRGRCSLIFSDCGTNFVGANRLLVEYMKSAVEADTIEWRFNPPSAPHFGGLFESGIKSVKTHLARVIGQQILTYEELNTLLVQVEAVLNSRPLCSVSNDPNDLTVLTSGHFLTLETITAPPDPDLSHLKLSRLSRWQLVQRLHYDFWKRWKNEYLHTFYQRGKWNKIKSFDAADVGTLVLIKDELAPPLQWRLGRIVHLHFGSDKIARVATLQTKNGLVKRPLVKLCPLPSQ